MLSGRRRINSRASERVCNSRPSRSLIGAGIFLTNSLKKHPTVTLARGRYSCSPVALRIAGLRYPAGMDQADAYAPPGMPLPTVAHDRGHGITSLIVYCAAGTVCPHSKDFTFEELRLTDDMVMSTCHGTAALFAANAEAEG